MPNLLGRASGDAQAEVEAAALLFTVSEQLFSDEAPIGTIMAQSVEPGTEVPRGSEIRVAVSRGPDLVTFPDLSTAPTYEAAAAILTPAGFQPVLTFGDAQGAIQSVAIDGQPPQVGTTYRRGTVVEITAL